ncbi:hypothetical protein [Desulfatitalea tepidiphila]|uniref:hypothetical protein n=1 Tax=Desulfatitalea tepidiphila TaxID=1185843 RepID=UPI0006B5D5CF|nr:hypothetical protein [Desulfatitalea tepidiphila]
MRKFSWSNLLILVLVAVLCACSGGGSDDGNENGGDIVRSWGTAETLETSSQDAEAPQIAMSDDGTAIAVWRQFDGTQYDIWANRYDGSSWGTAELIESDDTGDAEFPQVAMDVDGGAIAVWGQFDGTLTNIWANRFDGSAWGTAELIEHDDTNNAAFPQVAVDADGGAIAVWEQYDGTRFSIWANRFDGSAWEGAGLIETDNAGDASKPQVAMNESGQAMAVWKQSDGTRNNIWASRFNGSTWDTAAMIEDENLGSVNSPQIAMSADGRAIAVWDQNDGFRDNIWANRFNGSAWGTAEKIEDEDLGHARDPQIAMSTDGDAIAVWHQYDGFRFSIRSNRFDGGAWGTAVLIEDDDTGHATFPQVAMDADGCAIAVWYQYDGLWHNIQANRFDGATWTGAEMIEDDDTENAYDPQIAMTADGNAIAVWQQTADGNHDDIWSNRYE